jgi:uncharacterized membrane protein YbhN (UPF0104 family)
MPSCSPPPRAGPAIDRPGPAGPAYSDGTRRRDYGLILMREPQPRAVPNKRSPTSSAHLRAAFVWLGLAVTAGLLYLSVRGLDVRSAWKAARSSTPLWLLPSGLALAAAIALRAARWRSLFAASSRPDFAPTLSAYLVGLFFNNILPLRAGEAGRIVALVRRTRGSAAEVTATVALERVLDVTSLLVLLLVCSPWLPHLTWLRAAAVVAIPVVLALPVAAALLARFGDRPIEIGLAPLRLLPFLDDVRFTGAARNIGRGLLGLRSARTAAIGCSLTVASWLALAVSSWLLTLAFHLHVPLLAGVLVVVATNIGQVLPSSPAALGVFEAATLLALSAYGIDRSAGLPYAVELHALNLVPFLLLGPVALRSTPVVSLAARLTAGRQEVA